jgi:transcriptional regulator with XRE-family HTH domain
MRRRMAQLSLRGLSELAQVSNAYLSQLERGLHQPSLRVLHAIADALNVSAEALIAHAGMTEPVPADGPSPSTNTEEAIGSDPDLTLEERDVLIRLYRSFKEQHRSIA